VYAHVPLLAVAFIGNAGQNAEETLSKRCWIFGIVLTKTMPDA